MGADTIQKAARVEKQALAEDELTEVTARSEAEQTQAIDAGKLKPPPGGGGGKSDGGRDGGPEGPGKGAQRGQPQQSGQAAASANHPHKNGRQAHGRRREPDEPPHSEAFRMKTKGKRRGAFDPSVQLPQLGPLLLQPAFQLGQGRAARVTRGQLPEGGEIRTVEEEEPLQDLRAQFRLLLF